MPREALASWIMFQTLAGEAIQTCSICVRATPRDTFVEIVTLDILGNPAGVIRSGRFRQDARAGAEVQQPQAALDG